MPPLADPFSRAWSPRNLSDFMDRYSSRLTSYATAMVKDKDEADDVVQKTWIAAYSASQQCVGTPPFGWILGICRNTAIDHLRSRARQLRLRTWLATQGTSDRMLIPAEPRELAGELLQAISGLSPRRRDAVIYRIIEGYSVRETSAAMGCADGTVKALLFQGLEQLREVLHAER